MATRRLVFPLILIGVTIQLAGAAGAQPMRPAEASSEQGFEYVTSLRWRSLQHAAIRDDFAYCAFPYGFMVLDVTTPSAPTSVAQVFMSTGSGARVVLDGDYAYVAHGVAGLQVLNVSDPYDPRPVDTYDTPDNALSVTLAGTLAFIADGSGVIVVDIVNPASPLPVGSYYGTGLARDVAVAADYAYVAGGPDGLKILNVADPAAPFLAGAYDTLSGEARGIDISGGFAYLAKSSDGLYIIDVADPAAPQLAGILDLPEDVVAVTIVDTLAFLGVTGSLVIVNVVDPSAPELVGSLETTEGAPCKVAVSGDIAYYPLGYSLELFDIADPASPSAVGSFDASFASYDIEIADPYAYVAGSGLAIFDISNPADPVLVGMYDGRLYFLLTLVGERAYAAAGDYLDIFDVSNPSNPALIGSWNLTYDPFQGATFVWGLDAAGDYAYLSYYFPGYGPDTGLVIIDATNPAAPFLAGAYLTENKCPDVHVAGNYAYLAANNLGLYFVDISDPANPVTVSHFTDLITDGLRAKGVRALGDLAYVTVLEIQQGTDGLRVLDYSDPASPYLVGSVDGTSAWNFGELAGDHAFAVGYAVVAVNIADPTAPYVTDLSPLPVASMFADVAIAGDYAYVGTESLLIILRRIDYVRGDTNDDGFINAGDIIALVSYVFKGGPPPVPLVAAGDTNCDGFVAAADIILLVNYVFKSGPTPGCD